MERPNIIHIFDSYELSKKTKTHLQNVYYEMTIGLCITAITLCVTLFSCYANNSILPILYALSIPLGIIQLGLIIYMLYSNKYNKKSYFYTFSALEGLTLVPIINISNIIDNSLVITALIITIIVFGSFTYLSFQTNKRSVLYLSGILSSCLISLTVISLLNLCLHYEILFKIDLYLGLAIFCIYIIYDTQMIIKEADDGNYDVTFHAMTFYLDFINIFVRILLILMRNTNNKKKK
jgi:FtsH-binding integral membrane protein